MLGLVVIVFQYGFFCYLVRLFWLLVVLGYLIVVWFTLVGCCLDLGFGVLVLYCALWVVCVWDLCVCLIWLGWCFCFAVLLYFDAASTDCLFGLGAIACGFFWLVLCLCGVFGF